MKYNFDWGISQRLRREKQAEQGKRYAKMSTGFMLTAMQEKKEKGR